VREKGGLAFGIMGSYEQAMDVGKILLHALGELKSIRGTLHGDEGRDIDGNVALDEALAKAEHSLREKAEQLSEVTHTPYPTQPCDYSLLRWRQ
jgi:hypothetical protein